MDILDILLDILLKPPQPFIGLFYLIGVRFGLSGLKEQYDLRRYPDSQINIVKIDGKDALVYREFQSKTRQGGYLIGVKIQQGFPIVFVQG